MRQKSLPAAGGGLLECVNNDKESGSGANEITSHLNGLDIWELPLTDYLFTCYTTFSLIMAKTDVIDVKFPIP